MAVAKAVDRDYFAQSSLSLMTCLLAADPIYEDGEFPPPFTLEWDCQGSIEERADGSILLSGAEIKSCKKGKTRSLAHSTAADKHEPEQKQRV